MRYIFESIFRFLSLVLKFTENFQLYPHRIVWNGFQILKTTEIISWRCGHTIQTNNFFNTNNSSKFIINLIKFKAFTDQ
jgi:hypothetical protein